MPFMKTVCGQDVPKCFTQEEMREWLQLTRVVREPGGESVCDDCGPNGRLGLWAAGKCEKSKWSSIRFKFTQKGWVIKHG